MSVRQHELIADVVVLLGRVIAVTFHLGTAEGRVPVVMKAFTTFWINFRLDEDGGVARAVDFVAQKGAFQLTATHVARGFATFVVYKDTRGCQLEAKCQGTQETHA